MSLPAISVIMPVYNSHEFLSEAIDSILGQTFSDFEFIIINDGSTDNSLEIIKSYKDPRIKVLNNSSNIGNYPSRNKGIKVSRGKYICVMDSDDYAWGMRFERQFEFMERNTEIGLAGTGFRYYGQEQEIFREDNYERIKVLLFHNICFIHPTLIIRHEFLRENNLQYNEEYYYASDYDFIVRAARYFPVTNIREVLFSYRRHPNQISSKNSIEQSKFVNKIVLSQLNFIGIYPNEIETRLHINFIRGNHIPYIKRHMLSAWISTIQKRNQISHYFKQDELVSFLNAMMLLQPHLGKFQRNRISRESKTREDKYDLIDVTFLIPVRIDSNSRMRNLYTLVHFINMYFLTNIIIIESDVKRNCFFDKECKNLKYEFLKDNKDYFHRTKIINRLISLSRTPYIAIWETDVFAVPEQILQSVTNMRKSDYVMSLPYDGRYFLCDKVSSEIFSQTGEIGVLNKRITMFQLRNGYHCYGGAYIMNREKYLLAGGENEKIIDSFFEDAERIKRLESLNLGIHRSKGPLFHVWHPVENFKDKSKLELHNIKELLDTCNRYN